jgi:hypothetical protein
MGVFNKLSVAIAVAVAASFAATEGFAQSPVTPPATGQRPPSSGGTSPTLGAEKTIEGQVKSVNPSGTEITLTDGTTLVAPPGAAIRPGILAEGSIIVASYREENGNNVMTELALKEPAASPRTAPRTPSEPPTSPPRQAPPRY